MSERHRIDVRRAILRREVERARVSTRLVSLISAALILAVSGVASSQGDDAGGGDLGDVSLKELSQQSANPVSKFAFVFTQFASTFNDGDLANGDAKAAGDFVFQPIIPIPLVGKDEDEWRIVTRPTISLFAGRPTPNAAEEIRRDTGLSDLLIPLPVALPESMVGKWLLAAGPSFSFPTATDDDFGKNQWTTGVSGVIGYIGENWMAGAYPQYYWRIADANRQSEDRDASFGNMFYWFFYNITDDWQIGWNPTIQFDAKAGDNNKWNVPVGVTIAKVTTLFGAPIRIEAGVEYSVVNQDDYGERARIKVNLIPIVSRPIKSPILNFLFGR